MKIPKYNTIKHSTIVITTKMARQKLQEVVDRATALGLPAVMQERPAANGVLSAVIFPSGGAEGFETTRLADEARKEIIQWVKSDPDYEFFAVEYGKDLEECRVTVTSQTLSLPLSQVREVSITGKDWRTLLQRIAMLEEAEVRGIANDINELHAFAAGLGGRS